MRKSNILTSDQKEAIKAILKWRAYPRHQIFYLGGGAGTGKTEVGVHLQHLLQKQPQYASFTGRGTSELRRRGGDNGTTLCSLLYLPPPERISGPLGEP